MLLCYRRAGQNRVSGEIVVKRENKHEPSSAERLMRMRRMFAKNGAILADDYEHFTRQDEPIALSKAPRKSVEQNGKQAPKSS
jgi:hypothetical protein